MHIASVLLLAFWTSKWWVCSNEHVWATWQYKNDLQVLDPIHFWAHASSVVAKTDPAFDTADTWPGAAVNLSRYDPTNII